MRRHGASYEPARHLPLRAESLSFANARVPGRGGWSFVEKRQPVIGD
jgi:hypothetical protein